MKLLDESTAKSHRFAAELLNILRSLPDEQVRDVLQQLRAGRDASNIVTTLRGQLHSAYDVPFHGILHGVPPPDQTSLEFELMVRHAIAYSPWAPTELPHLDVELSTPKPNPSLSVETPSAAYVSDPLESFLRAIESQPLQSPVSSAPWSGGSKQRSPPYRVTKLDLHRVSPMSTEAPSPLPPTESESSLSSGGRTRLSHSEGRESSSSSFGIGAQSKTGAFRETTAPELPPLCDERIHKLDILAWTNVPIPNDAAKKVLSLYLETDHAFTALFDVDLFLVDLISHSTRFCSRLLVSALFSWACQAYTAFELEAANWSYAFYDEAVQTLEHETSLGLGTPSTVAAVIYLSMSSTCHAKNSTDSVRHLETAVDLAKSMGLFGIAEDAMLHSWPDGATDALWERSMSQTAWGSFVYITIQCAQNKKCKISHPPRLPIPGDVEDLEEIEVVERQHARFMGITFPFLCRLALIAHDMVWMNYAGTRLGPTVHAMAESMESIYRRYLEWADDLPLELARSGESTHHVLLLHIYLHALVLDLFRPLLSHGDAMRIRLETFTSRQASPEAVCLASTTQLKRIAIMYFQMCTSASHSFGWNTALLYIANAALREPPYAVDIAERRADFRTCILGYQKLQRCYRLAQGIVKGLLSMALREGVVASSEARAIMRDSDEKGRHHPAADAIQAPFVVDLDLAMTDPAAALVDRLAGEFDELAILDEFTVVTTTWEVPEISSEAVGSDLEG
ncbi:Nitrogen assimilation transcription factor nit-4 [Colletotrichum trifolii]|uniref:Nitrogen assimilation transcription factor nit-4 n=1 Tax=Colletotrichum trifolii TaxID=5466 RepID=A0A4R8RFA1_COLTR|nr:Nitrogen assimilation transcription factor nit-4 [Colletotrichum trifolii]